MNKKSRNLNTKDEENNAHYQNRGLENHSSQFLLRNKGSQFELRGSQLLLCFPVRSEGSQFELRSLRIVVRSLQPFAVNMRTSHNRSLQSFTTVALLDLGFTIVA